MKHTLNNFPILAMSLTLVMALAACSGPSVGRVQGKGEVTYGNPEDVETVNTRWGSSDLQMTAERMTQSMLASRYISQAQTQPKIRLREVRNMTSEHIDTKGITDKIRVRMLQSGQVRFLADEANLTDVRAERELNEEMTERLNNDLIAETDYIVTGNVRSIRKRTKDVADVFYQITLELVDPQSGEIVWADEQEIRKTTTRPHVGW